VKVHHLNCGTMRPPGVVPMVCHCLLVETEQGLVLVDTGFGVDEAAKGTADAMFRLLTRPAFDPAEPAVHQVERLGFQRRDVRHVVLTHMDLDHAGGLRDFPWARVHVYAEEHRAATAPATALERRRYQPAQWAHGPHWVTYAAAEGEPWFGFSAVRPLDGLDGLALVPLIGHTRGHSAVAVPAGDGWLLHAGDAYFHHGEVDPDRPRCPPTLRLFQRLNAADHERRLANVARLRELVRAQNGAVEVFSAHDAQEFARY
jgi:glyoxylase-like metal-dependent hydrolase (beta-lactamase superfamily II)